MKFLVDVFKNSEVFNSLEKAVVRGVQQLFFVPNKHFLKKKTTQRFAFSAKTTQQTVAVSVADNLLEINRFDAFFSNILS